MNFLIPVFLSAVSFLNDSSPQIQYQGQWHIGPENQAYHQDNRWTQSPDASLSINFRGKRIALYGARAPYHGKAQISLDDGETMTLDYYAPERQDNVLIYLSPVLADGEHKLRLRATGEKADQAEESWITIDRAVVFGEAESVAAYSHPPDASSHPVLGYRLPKETGLPWAIDLPVYDRSVYTHQAVVDSSEKYGKLADLFQLATRSSDTYEWDYGFHYGWGGGFVKQPRDRDEAYAMLEGFYKQSLAREKKLTPFPYSATGHYYYSHAQAKWSGSDLDIIYTEIGENIKCTSCKIAFTRGAARQYGKAWGLQFSPWWGGGVLDYSTHPVWVNGDGLIHSGRTHGHSLELAKRSYYLKFMAGANLAAMESASVNWFNGEAKDANGHFSLSPLGEIGKSFYDFTHRFTDRGLPYAPIAIMIPENHGLGLDNGWAFPGYAKDLRGQQIRFGFDFRPGDRSMLGLFNTIWPKAFEETSWDEGAFFMGDTPYGEIFDVLTDDASAEVLKHYPALILAGDLKKDPEIEEKLQAYTRNGGTLVRGGQSGNWHPMLKKLHNSLVPFQIEGSIQYLINKTEAGWNLTLINNKGVSKEPMRAAVLDPSQAKVVSVVYRLENEAILSVREELTGTDIAVDQAGQFLVKLPPGDVRILNIRLKP